MAVLSDWEMQARALPSNAAWGSFPQLLGSALARDNLLSPSSCKEVLPGCCEPEKDQGKTEFAPLVVPRKICLSLLMHEFAKRANLMAFSRQNGILLGYSSRIRVLCIASQKVWHARACLCMLAWRCVCCCAERWYLGLVCGEALP